MCFLLLYIQHLKVKPPKPAFYTFFFPLRERTLMPLQLINFVPFNQYISNSLSKETYYHSNY